MALHGGGGRGGSYIGIYVCGEWCVYIDRRGLDDVYIEGGGCVYIELGESDYSLLSYKSVEYGARKR
jgi:hypothetical protein